MAEERKKQRRERIEALNAINEVCAALRQPLASRPYSPLRPQDVTSMLRAAALAVSALTNKPLDPTATADTTGDPVEDRKAAFKLHSTAYFNLTKRIKSSLESESEALQTEELIPAKKPPARIGTGDDEITNGGLGNFDIGWLNSRNDNVRIGKEAEVWKEVRQMLERREGRADGADAAMEDGESRNGTNNH